MSNSEIKLQDIELAWKRVKLDIPQRVFIRDPFEIQLIEQDLTSYLTYILKLIQDNTYNPKPIRICNIPKGHGLIRPGASLSLEDRVSYYWCLGMCLPQIYETLKWSQGITEFAYQFSGDFENAEWLKKPFICWDNFRKKSLEKITDQVHFVITTDIAAYYENIDLTLLLSDLRAAGVSSDIANLLNKCLHRWAQVTGRGIPQGYSPSDFLGKLYLNSVDLNLKAMGFEHLRYVDDIRIFCVSESQAKKALIALSELLRKRGLNLQSAKTQIYPVEDARKAIEAVQPILQPILHQYTQNIIEKLKMEIPSLSLSEADELLKQIHDDNPIEVIKEAFKKYFLEGDDKDFDKTLW